MTIDFIVSFALALTVTALATFFAIPLMRFFGLLDDPQTHRHPAIMHTSPIPRGGGLAIFLGVCIASFFFLPKTSLTIGLFIAGSIAVITGILDDKYDISPYIRFIVNIICAIIVVASGVSISFITNPLGGILHLDNLHVSLPFVGSIPFFSFVVTILWIVWVMNMLNWSKGVDGQMPGIVAISAIVIGILSLRFSLSDPSLGLTTHLSFIIAGSAIGFLFFNFYPAKIFPGYSATAMYLLLAVVSLLSTAKFATAVLVMGVPMIDGIFTAGRRLLAGKSPFKGDNKHLHHLLLRLGYSQRSIALFYWVISGILGAVALTLSSKGKLFAILMLAIIVGGSILFLHIILREKNETHHI